MNLMVSFVVVAVVIVILALEEVVVVAFPDFVLKLDDRVCYSGQAEGPGELPPPH